MKDEVRAAIKMMKHGKALGSDDVALEVVEALGEFGIEKVTNILDEIYNNSEKCQSQSSLRFQRNLEQQNVNSTEPLAL